VVELPGANDTIMAVADGIGGREAGDIASFFALRYLLQERLAARAETLATAAAVADMLAAGLRQANYLLSSVNRQLGGTGFLMGTTVVAAAFVEAEAVVLHAGDSRCYRLRDGRIQQLTRDDTWAETLVSEGALQPSEVARHPWAHTLCNCLGVAPEVALNMQRTACRPGDCYLLCSDGVSQMLDDDQITHCLDAANCADDAVRNVIRESLRQGGRDNITAAVAFP